MNAVTALKLAYLKYHMGDPSLTDAEVNEAICDALCNEYDADWFCRFTENNRKRIDRNEPLNRAKENGKGGGV